MNLSPQFYCGILVNVVSIRMIRIRAWSNRATRRLHHGEECFLDQINLCKNNLMLSIWIKKIMLAGMLVIFWWMILVIPVTLVLFTHIIYVVFAITSTCWCQRNHWFRVYRRPRGLSPWNFCRRNFNGYSSWVFPS